MCDELVNLKLTTQVVLDELRKLRSTLDTTERASLPYTARDQLEGYGMLATASLKVLVGFTYGEWQSPGQQQQHR